MYVLDADAVGGEGDGTGPEAHNPQKAKRPKTATMHARGWETRNGRETASGGTHKRLRRAPPHANGERARERESTRYRRQR